MLEMLSYPFMQRALIGGLFVGILSGYYGVFVVQRGLGFMGSGLAHATFGGIAAALLMGAQPSFVAVPFTIIVAIGITYVKSRTGLGSDTSIGIFFAVSMALGIILLSFKSGYTATAINYLFGSILAVETHDNIIILFPIFLSVVMWSLWKNWAYATFDRDLAKADGVPVERDDYILSIMIALTVVLSVKIVGIVLMTALLVLPAATARMLSHSFSGMTFLSVLIGGLSVPIGVVISYFLDLPSGATAVIFGSLIFFVTVPFRRNK